MRPMDVGHGQSAQKVADPAESKNALYFPALYDIYSKGKNVRIVRYIYIKSNNVRKEDIYENYCSFHT